MKNQKFRVWHIPQVGMDNVFHVEVNSLKEAVLILNTLWDYDLFQFEHKVKPDYANASGLEVLENGDWREWLSPEYEGVEEYIRNMEEE